MIEAKKPVCVELDRLLAEAKNMKPKRNLSPEQMDELNEKLFGTLKPKSSPQRLKNIARKGWGK